MTFKTEVTDSIVENQATEDGNSPNGVPSLVARKGEAIHNSTTTYYILDVNTVVAYVEETLPKWLPLDPRAEEDEADIEGGRLRRGEIVSAEEVGDGNLNLVFRLLDDAGRCRAVLKQSLPYVRCVGESWPLTLDRNRLEATTLLAHYVFDQEVVERVVFHDSNMAVTVVEDLSDCVIWRRELVKGHYYTHVAPALGRYLARVFFHTSDLFQSAGEKKKAVQEFTNVAMCGITEDLFFADPYVVHERNNYEPEQESLVASLLRGDDELKGRVARLKYRFMNCPEAHLHGDIHSGSVFVDARRVKAIDAEFGFYGPMGFDLGTLVGNLLINYIALPALLETRAKASVFPRIDSANEQEESGRESPRVAVDLSTCVPSTPALLLQSVADAWRAFHEEFSSLAAAQTRDVSFTFPGFVPSLLRDVWADTLGYAGSEMVRRTIGLAHVVDLDSIADKKQRLQTKESVLHLGVYLIKHAGAIDNVDQLAKVVRERLYER